jgi:hypothetical protein
MLAWQRAARAAHQTGRRHVRKISSEMNRVVTKPISNSISNSFQGVSGVAGWYEYWLADGSGIKLMQRTATMWQKRGTSSVTLNVTLNVERA